MSDIAIHVEGLGKLYRIGAKADRPEGLRHALENGLRNLGRRFSRKPSASPRTEDFWALRDVSFEVKRGECVGIIGRNGAGKSTLLKILSRITEPTTGQIRMKGRVGSLLEVGTGFHPELTGRENIYLNGAVLGMSRREITRKFDEIVAFSEVEKFLDTPVKYYSSGMYTRLAFAVAAHLEPEILIVDEVLAVGDAEFQKKCLGKMGEVAKGGRTVLFVSHNIGAVKHLCSMGILLASGKSIAVGPMNAVLTQYLNRVIATEHDWRDERPQNGESAVRLKRVRLVSADNETARSVSASENLTIEIEYDIRRLTTLQIAFRINQNDGTTVLTSADGDHEFACYRKRETGKYRARATVPAYLLRPGQYHLQVAANQLNSTHDLVDPVLSFEIDPAGALLQMDPTRQGVVFPLLEWSEMVIEDAAHVDYSAGASRSN